MAKTTPSPKAPFIMAIFTNFLFVVGVVMMITGFVKGTSTVAKLALFEKYPLQSYDESRCNYGYYPEPMMMDGVVLEDKVEDRKAEQEKQKQQCLGDLERQRSVQKVEDVTFAVSAFIAGLVLTLAFKQFIFQKK